MIADPNRREEGTDQGPPEPSRNSGSQESRVPEGRAEDSDGGNHEWRNGTQHERGPSERSVSIATVVTAWFGGISCLLVALAILVNR